MYLQDIKKLSLSNNINNIGTAKWIWYINKNDSGVKQPLNTILRSLKTKLIFWLKTKKNIYLYLIQTPEQILFHTIFNNIAKISNFYLTVKQDFSSDFYFIWSQRIIVVQFIPLILKYTQDQLRERNVELCCCIQVKLFKIFPFESTCWKNMDIKPDKRISGALGNQTELKLNIF